MRSSSDDPLVLAAFEGALSAKEFGELQRRLGAEPELLERYRDHALLHHVLAEEFESALLPALPSRVRVRRASPRWLPVALAAAAAGVLAVGGWKMLTRPVAYPRVPAGLALSHGAVAAIDDRAAATGAEVAMGSRLRVTSGFARLDFSDHSSALIEGPAVLVYEADGRLALDEGRGRFRSGGREGLTVRTPAFTAIDRGTEFGVLAKAAGGDELHVFQGEVAVETSVGQASALLHAGEAAAVGGAGSMKRMSSRPEDFSGVLPESRELLADRFAEDGGSLTGRLSASGAAMWRTVAGEARLTGSHLEGSEFLAFCRLPEVGPTERHPVLLVTMETDATGNFHTPGWAGLSLLRATQELCFFGDSFGPEVTWSLDVKQGLPPAIPATPVTGARTVTLRYDRRTGAVELHEGAGSRGTPFVRSMLPAGLSFDEIRLGASAGAALAVRAVTVTVTDAP